MPQEKRKRGPRGEGSVVRIVDKVTGEIRWRIKINARDQFDRRKVITKKMPRGTSEAAAHREKRRMLNARDAGRLQHTAHEAIGSFLRRWLDGLEASSPQNTSNTYRSLTQLYLLPALGHLPLSKLERKHVRALLEQIIRDGKQPTATIVQSVLIRALDVAIDEGSLVENVGRLVKLSSIVRSTGVVPHRTKTKQAPQPEHVALLVAHLEPHAYGLPVAVMAVTGMRIAETLGMAYPKLNQTTGVFLVQQNLTYTKGFQLGPTKTGAMRMIGLDDEILARLAQWERDTLTRRMARGRGTWLVEQSFFRVRPGFPDLSADLIFTHGDGRPFLPLSIRRTMITACEVLGIPPIRPHDLRHFVDTQLAKAQIDPETRRGYLGHESAAMDRVYVHTDPERLRAAASIMSEQLRKHS